LVVSDNGASQEGLQDGVTNTDRYRNYNPETVRGNGKAARPDRSPATDPLYRWVGHWPATRLSRSGNRIHTWVATQTHSIVSWPAKIKDNGAIRKQYHHLVDVAPTILEVIGLPAPSLRMVCLRCRSMG